MDQKDIEDTRKQIKEGMKLLNKQQKVIRIADREEDGWEVVKHYLSDDLASGSDDEKAIKKARKAAAISKKQRVEKKQKERKTKLAKFRRPSFPE